MKPKAFALEDKDDFDELVEKLKKQGIKYFVVCRNSYTDELFYIVFKSKEQLDRFILRNNGDVDEIGFYAKGFVDGKFYDENT